MDIYIITCTSHGSLTPGIVHDFSSGKGISGNCIFETFEKAAEVLKYEQNRLSQFKFKIKKVNINYFYDFFDKIPTPQKERNKKINTILT